ncbi:TPA: hypothetical protein DEF17_07930 [bacterium]|nr:MAG: hypothetical protein AUJ18_10740 [Candidatus Hydrogenedentes bacterium CG1_02_42_14]HBW47840.1 hypothetical protein [bacterium]
MDSNQSSSERKGFIPPEPDEVRKLILALETAPRDISIHRSLGLLRWQRRELTEALIEFRKIFQIDNSNIESNFAIAAIYLERGMRQKTFEQLFSIAFREEFLEHHGEPFDLRRLERRFKDFPTPYDSIDWIELFTGLEKDFKVNEEYKRVALNEGNLSLTHKNYDKAIRIFTLLCVIEPRNSFVRLCLASSLSARRKDRAAELEFNEAILLEPKNPAGYKGLALIRARRGEIEKARETFEQVLMLDPEDPDARRWLARTG